MFKKIRRKVKMAAAHDGTYQYYCKHGRLVLVDQTLNPCGNVGYGGFAIAHKQKIDPEVDNEVIAFGVRHGKLVLVTRVLPAKMTFGTYTPLGNQQCDYYAVATMAESVPDVNLGELMLVSSYPEPMRAVIYIGGFYLGKDGPLARSINDAHVFDLMKK